MQFGQIKSVSSVPRRVVIATITFGVAIAVASSSMAPSHAGETFVQPVYAVNSYRGLNLSVAAIIYDVGRYQRENGTVSDRAMLAAFEAALAESELSNPASWKVPNSTGFAHDWVAAGDHDSVGVFQQRVGGAGRDGKMWGSVEQIMDPVHSTHRFFDSVDEMEWKTPGTAGQLAQAVQVSAHPRAYDARWQDAMNVWGWARENAELLARSRSKESEATVASMVAAEAIIGDESGVIPEPGVLPDEAVVAVVPDEPVDSSAIVNPDGTLPLTPDEFVSNPDEVVTAGGPDGTSVPLENYTPYKAPPESTPYVVYGEDTYIELPQGGDNELSNQGN